MNSFFLLFSSHFLHSPLRHPHNLQESAEIKQANPGDCDRKYVSFFAICWQWRGGKEEEKKLPFLCASTLRSSFFCFSPFFPRKKTRQTISLFSATNCKESFASCDGLSARWCHINFWLYCNLPGRILFYFSFRTEFFTFVTSFEVVFAEVKVTFLRNCAILWNDRCLSYFFSDPKIIKTDLYYENERRE